MNNIESALLETLVQFETAARSLPTAKPKPDLHTLLVRIDELTRQLPKTTDPTLLHYLYKRSYEKARLYLQGRDVENAIGNCKHDLPEPER